MKQVTALVLAVLMATSAFAGEAAPSRGSTAAKKPAKAKTETSVSEEIREMKEMLQQQQQQINDLKNQLQLREQALTQAQQQATDAASKAEAANAAANQSNEAVSALKSDVSDLKTSATNTAIAVQEDQKKVAEVSKSEDKLSDLAHGKVKIGATFYGNFTHYTDTGYSPAFQDLPTTQLPPGNSGLNAFEITRGYFNLFYTPDERVTLRITPDVYRVADGSLDYRLKYAFVDFQKLFHGSFAKDKVTFGQTQQPLTDWEEGLSGYRYTYLTPWNYVSLSSTYVGAKIHGPIEMNGKEYLDYDLGVFTTASFHAAETNDKKQVMGRLTVYPFGTTADRTGLGFTVFEDYGYNTKPPSVRSTPLNRLSLLAHYQTLDKRYQIAFEYQVGHNAASSGNLFSGAAPGSGDPLNVLAGAAFKGDTQQRGYNVFGRARLGHSPFGLFGLFQYFQPNTNYAGTNPFDFERTVGGLSYSVTKHFDLAMGDQNFHWIHPSLGADHGPDTNGIVFWTQFNY